MAPPASDLSEDLSELDPEQRSAVVHGIAPDDHIGLARLSFREWGLPVFARYFDGGQSGSNGSSNLAGASHPGDDHPSRLPPSLQRRQAGVPSQPRRPE